MEFEEIYEEKEKEIERLGKQAKVKLIDDVLYIMYEKVPNRWHDGMKEAFEKMNSRGYTTKEGWRIQLEI